MPHALRICHLLLALCLGFLPTLLLAQAQPVGYVKTVTDEAWVSTGGERSKAQPGLPVFLGSQLKTSKTGTLGVTFKDNTVMAFGPDTEFTVFEYVYAPSRGQYQLSTNLVKGTLYYISGLIAKLKPESVSIKTLSGTLGVRGTQFLVKVEDPSP